MLDWDVRILFALYGGTEGAWRPLMIAATVLGNGWPAAVLMPMLAHAKTRRFAGLLAVAIVVQASLVTAIKSAVGRVRPWIALHLPPPIGSPADPSFPSGHAAGAFCVATFLALVLPVAAWPHAPATRRALVALAAVTAALVATSRVYLGAHFPTDVMAGALLGGLVGAGAGRLYLEPPPKSG